MTSAKAVATGEAGAQPGTARRSPGVALLAVGVALLGGAGVFFWRRSDEQPWMQGFRKVAEYPHDGEAYTQGLLFDDGILYESTGQRGFSSVRAVEIESGKVLRRTELPYPFFGEGLALAGDRLIQLTWEEGVARIYDPATLKPLDQFEYEGEGWGLTFDGEHLVMSDGSEVLVFRDPKTFQEVRRVRVLAKGAPVRMLNELEMVAGEVWANVWKQEYLVRIDPRTGAVLGYVNLKGLFDNRSIRSADAVLNGIAYDPKSKRLFVTGKLWPKLFEIEVVAQ